MWVTSLNQQVPFSSTREMTLMSFRSVQPRLSQNPMPSALSLKMNRWHLLMPSAFSASSVASASRRPMPRLR